MVLQGRIRHLLRHAERDRDYAEPAWLQHRDHRAVEQRLRPDVGVGQSASGNIAAGRSVPGAGRRHTLRDASRQRARGELRRGTGADVRQSGARARADAAVARWASSESSGATWRSKWRTSARTPTTSIVTLRGRRPGLRSTGTTPRRETRRSRRATTPTCRIPFSSAICRPCGRPIRRCTTSLPRRRCSRARRFRSTGC